MKKILLPCIKIFFWVIQHIKYFLAACLFRICGIKIWKWFKYFWSLSGINTVYFVGSENLTIWNNVFIWAGLYCNAYNGVYIWDNAMISHNVAIISANHKMNKETNTISRSEYAKTDPITIWEWAWLWYNVTILPWVKIWKNAVVWAMSIVTKDIPDNWVAIWNPAKLIKTNI